MNVKPVVLPILALALFASNEILAADNKELTTEHDRFSYGLGMLLGANLLQTQGKLDLDLVIEGIQAQYNNTDLKLTLEEAQLVLKKNRDEKMEKDKLEAQMKIDTAKQKGEEYLKANAEKDGVTVTESGLQYSVITEGDGAMPKAADQVTVHYRGTLLDGTEFDSSYSRNAPATFGLNQVIRGWTEGVQLMKVGSKYQFVIPYALAYGERGAGGSIGPFETLIFEVELLEIKG
jgi:FKBP-type peptidyl-prolyl cis-trans isomerase